MGELQLERERENTPLTPPLPHIFQETIAESYEDVEVYDEHPANYFGEGGASVIVGDGEDLVYHLPKGGASNYDHLVRISY